MYFFEQSKSLAAIVIALVLLLSSKQENMRGFFCATAGFWFGFAWFTVITRTRWKTLTTVTNYVSLNHHPRSKNWLTIPLARSKLASFWGPLFKRMTNCRHHPQRSRYITALYTYEDTIFAPIEYNLCCQQNLTIQSIISSGGRIGAAAAAAAAAAFIAPSLDERTTIIGGAVGATIARGMRDKHYSWFLIIILHRHFNEMLNYRQVASAVISDIKVYPSLARYSQATVCWTACVLAAVSGSSVCLSNQTTNYESAARLKLTPTGIDRFWSCDTILEQIWSYNNYNGLKIMYIASFTVSLVSPQLRLPAFERVFGWAKLTSSFSRRMFQSGTYNSISWYHRWQNECKLFQLYPGTLTLNHQNGAVGIS